MSSSLRIYNRLILFRSKPPKLRRQTLSEDYCYGCSPESEFASITQGSNTSSTIGLSVPSSSSGLPAGDRRKTIETCENIFLQAEESSKLRARTPPSNPHRVLLHRDKNDASIRTNGLGMRIVGGQECEDGSLGKSIQSFASLLFLPQVVSSPIFSPVVQQIFKVTSKLVIKFLNSMVIH